MEWEAVSAISTLVGTIVVTITIIFTMMQLNEAQKVRKLALIIKLFEELSSENSRIQRQFIYSSVPDEVERVTGEHFLVIDKVLSTMDLIYLLIEQDQIEKSYVFDAYEQVFIKIWIKLEPIIKFERTRRGGYYRIRSEYLVRQIQSYFKSKGLPTEYRIYNDMQLGNQVIDIATSAGFSNANIPQSKQRITNTNDELEQNGNSNNIKPQEAKLLLGQLLNKQDF